jgi:DNA invertase Pin-like site-specific DNA recombinase
MMKTSDINTRKRAENGDFIDGNVSGYKTIGYLRVSTGKQENEKNKAAILQFANEKKLGHVRFAEETVSGTKDWRTRELGNVLESLKDGDTLIVSELSRLGRSMLSILEVLKLAQERGIKVYAVKGAWSLDNSIQSKMVSGIFAMLAEVERDLISIRTKEALQARKAAGVKLGRRPGPGRSKLDRFDPEIKALLSTGSTLKYIALRYGCAESTLKNWLAKRQIDRRKLIKDSVPI